MKGYIEDYVVTENKTVDLSKLSDGVGVWKPTFHNYGDVNFKVNNIHTVKPNQCPFAINVEFPICSIVTINFDEPTQVQEKKCVISYAIKHC